MAVPEFYHFIRPALECLADGKARSWQDVSQVVVPRLGISAEDQMERTPSGTRTRAEDRSQWALTYLRQARLVRSAGRNRNEITERGREYLLRAPTVIKPADLMEFEEFRIFAMPGGRSRRPKGVSTESRTAPDSGSTPQEVIESGFRAYNVALAEDVLEHVKRTSPAAFEALIVNLMLKLGYGVDENSGRVLGRTGDEGVDGVISLDRLGLERIYLQAKRWRDTPVGSKEVQAFVGALSVKGAQKGVFITTSKFTKDAVDYQRNLQGFKVSLIDGTQLATLMIENELGVTCVTQYRLRRVDSDFFES